MAFQKYDPRAEYFDPVISAITDTGIVDHLFKIRMPYLGMKEPVQVEEKTLVLEHFYAPLMVLASGYLIANLVMLEEFFKIFFCLRIFRKRVKVRLN